MIGMSQFFSAEVSEMYIDCVLILKRRVSANEATVRTLQKYKT